MSSLLQISTVEEKIRVIRDQEVILDSELAKLYGVQTKEINQAVKNNPDKFPDGYIFELNDDEMSILRSKFLTAKFLTANITNNKTRVLPKAFTEKGAYMLATILKGKTATATTLAIVEAFAALRQLSRTVAELAKTTDKTKQKSLMQKSGEIFTDLIGKELIETESETTFKLNLAVLSLEHTVKRKKK